MIKHTITTTYLLEFELKNNSNYKFTKDGICINTKTNRIIRKVLNGSSVGFWIDKKFYSVNTLREELIKIKVTNL
jgi:hypothetical protein